MCAIVWSTQLADCQYFCADYAFASSYHIERNQFVVLKEATVHITNHQQLQNLKLSPPVS